MWNLRKKLFLSLLVPLFSMDLALAQTSSSQNSATQEQQIESSQLLEMDMTQVETSTASLNSDSESLKKFKESSAQSKSQSMNAATLLSNQETLLDSLETQWKSLQLQLQTLESLSSSLSQDNEKLQSMLASSSKTISDLKVNLEDYKKALASNKDDTDYIIGLFAEAQSELATVKEYVARLEVSKRHLKNVRITSIAFTGLGVGCCILVNNIPIDSDIKNLLNGLGIGLASASGLTLGISFVF